MMNKPINACSLCGQCSVLCPNGYDMAEICKLARENMVYTGKMSLAPHEFALMDMVFSNDEAFLCRPQPGFDKCKYVFFPGCQATAIAPATMRAAYLDLCSRLEGGVALMLGCCGAICDWAGRYEMYEDTVKFLDEKLEALGNPTVIAGCPTGKKQLSRHDTIGIWDILEDIGLPKRQSVRTNPWLSMMPAVPAEIMKHRTVSAALRKALVALLRKPNTAATNLPAAAMVA